MGWIYGGVKDQVFLDGGRYEMVGHSCFEDLEGGVRLKRVFEFVADVGKKRNERVKVNSDS